MDRLIDAGVQFGGVLVLLLIGWLVAKWVRKIVFKILAIRWPKLEPKAKKIGITFSVPKVASSIAYYTIMYIVVTSALKNLGVDLGIIENLIDTTISLIPIALVADWVLNGLKQTKRLLKGRL